MDCEKVKVNGKDILSTSAKSDRDYRVITYDFKRPDKFSLEQIRTVSIIHETFARLASLTLSGQLKHQAHLCVKCVDQLTFEEFLRATPSPSTLAILDLAPLKGSAVLEIDPHISSAITDRLFGGQGESLEENRELSETERAMMEAVTIRMLGNLKDAWSQVVDMTPSLGQIETNPQFAMIVPPTEMVILVSFDISIGDVNGAINFCIPYLTIEPIIEKLSAQYWYSTIRKSNDDDLLSSQMVSAMKMDSEILVKTEDLSLKRLGSLKKGSLIKLDGFREGQSSFRIGGEIVLSTRFCRGRKNITFTVDREDLLTEDVLGLLEKRTTGTDQNKLQENLKEISSQISKVSTDLTRRIEELSSSQDHLNDQVFLQSSGEPISSVNEDQPFGFIDHQDLKNLYQIIVNDHPQLNALILSRLDSALSAELLEMFSSEVQTDLIRRISRMDRVAPEVIKEIERILEKSFNLMTESQEPELKGIEKITEILNISSRSVEKNIVESLEIKDNILAEEIKKKMFVFEDIVVLDGDSVSRIVERADHSDLYLSMKVIDEKVKSYIFDQISEKKKIELIEGIDKIGRVKISDIDKAQLRIVSLIREMEENGEVVVCHPDEMVE